MCARTLHEFANTCVPKNYPPALGYTVCVNSTWERGDSFSWDCSKSVYKSSDKIKSFITQLFWDGSSCRKQLLWLLLTSIIKKKQKLRLVCTFKCLGFLIQHSILLLLQLTCVQKNFPQGIHIGKQFLRGAYDKTPISEMKQNFSFLERERKRFDMIWEIYNRFVIDRYGRNVLFYFDLVINKCFVANSGQTS